LKVLSGIFEIFPNKYRENSKNTHDVSRIYKNNHSRV
jgi:hypothetical protein